MSDRKIQLRTQQTAELSQQTVQLLSLLPLTGDQLEERILDAVEDTPFSRWRNPRRRKTPAIAGSPGGGLTRTAITTLPPTPKAAAGIWIFTATWPCSCG